MKDVKTLNSEIQEWIEVIEGESKNDKPEGAYLALEVVKGLLAYEQYLLSPTSYCWGKMNKTIPTVNHC